MADKQDLRSDDLKEDPEDKLVKEEDEEEEQEELDREPEEAPQATFTKPEPDEDSRLEESDEREEDESASSSESTLNDLVEEESSDDAQDKPFDSAQDKEVETPQHDIPPLNSSDSGYFQRNFTRGVNQTISPNRNRSSKIHLVILLLIGLAVIGGTVYLLKSQFPGNSPSPTPMTTPTVSLSPSPTPQAIDRSKFKIRVLNGTSTTGLAASVSAKLKELGYQTDKVGNATNSAFQTTLVRVKQSSTILLDQLIKDLSPDHSATSFTELKDSDSADGEIILGTK